MASQADRSCKPGRSACMRKWSSSLIITQSVSSLFSTSPLPTFLAACSRLTRWRSTRICLSIAVRLSIDSEKAPSICGRLSTAGRTISSALTRSAFLAQPGNENALRLRARRTRLDITMRTCGPSRLHDCAGAARNSWMFFIRQAVLTRRLAIKFFSRLFDFIPQNGGLLEILVGDGFLELLLQFAELFGIILVLLQWLWDFAHMLRPFVHRLEQALQT